MKKTKKHFIYNVLMVICAIAFSGSAGMLAHKLYEEKKQEDVFAQLMDVFPQFEGTAGAAGANSGISDGQTLPRDPLTGEVSLEAVQESVWEEWSVRLEGYDKLYMQNNDFIGWIRIDGTQIDYPVMQSLDRPDYYLHRNFEKNYSTYGVPYVSEFCVVGDEGTNLLLYGHHMKNGSMFASLDGYRDAKYYIEHPYIRFDTLESASIYEVVGAWLIPNAASAEQVEELFHLLFAQSEEEFASGWKAVNRRLFVSTGIEPTAEGKLLALVTCDYSYNDSRIVVLAQKTAE